MESRMDKAKIVPAKIPLGFRLDFARISLRFRYDSATILQPILREICKKSAWNLRETLTESRNQA